MNFAIGDIIQMKKKHPCGSDKWQIWRMGMDFGIKCCECGRKIMMPRAKFEKAVKAIVKTKDIEDN